MEETSTESERIVGVSASLVAGLWSWPVHGLRHPPTSNTTGWYIWTGELTQDEGFFQPWHVGHLLERIPQLVHLLDLPSGTRFLIAPGHEDIWEDPTLLNV